MPTYDYQCPKCKSIKELIHPISDLEKPGKELIKEITCFCNKTGTLMLRIFTKGSGGVIGLRKENNLKERRKRNSEHFKKKVLPGIEDKDSLRYFNKKHGTKINT